MSETSSTKKARRNQFNRVWLFRTVCVVFPVVCIFSAEAMLRWQGYGIPPALVMDSERDQTNQTAYLNPSVDRLYCAIDLAGPEPMGFPRRKSDQTLRVLVLGASSVQGYPHPSELAFPRHLSLILKKQLPDREVEVRNAGIIGLASTPIVDLTSQAFSVKPDILVLYSGHNEFYGVGGVATNAPLSPLGIALGKSRLIRCLSGISTGRDANSSKGGPDLIETLPASYQIPAGSPLISRADSVFRTNIRRIINLCRQHKIPLVICTPVSNLRDQSPLVLEADMPILRKFEKPIQELTSQKQWKELQTLVKQQLEDCPECAFLHYRLAQAFEASGRQAEAAAEYIQARDLDPCRYRTSSRLIQILKDTVKEASSEVWLLDLVSLFENHTKHASPGRDLFLEHVHMTIDGHWLTAKGLAEKLVVEVLNRTWHPENVPSATERDEFLHLRTEDRLVAMTLASFIYASRPFRESIDREKHVEALLHEIRRLTESLSPEERIAYESLDHATKMHDLIDGLGRFHLAAGRWKEAEDFFQSSMERRPRMPNGYVFTAVTRHLQNDETTARTYLKASYHTVVPETAPLVKDRQRLIREMGQREAL